MERQEAKMRKTFNRCVANNVYRMVAGMGDEWMTDRHRLDRYFEEVVTSLNKGRIVYEFELRLRNFPVRMSPDAVRSFRKDFVLEKFFGGELQADHDWKRHIYEKTKTVIWRESGGRN